METFLIQTKSCYIAIASFRLSYALRGVVFRGYLANLRSLIVCFRQILIKRQIDNGDDDGEDNASGQWWRFSLQCSLNVSEKDEIDITSSNRTSNNESFLL